MTKLLYISNLSNGVSSFSKAAVLASKQLKMEFYLAANFQEISKEKLENDTKEYGVHFCQLDLDRSPYSKNNIKAYHQLVELINKEKFDVIHCNTPVGGLLGRLAGKKCGVKTVIYQAHGFHFYKGAPIKNWLFYYPVERWLAHYTDALITINQEDYEFAKLFNLKNKENVYYIPGVGIDLEAFKSNTDGKKDLKKLFNFDKNDFILISVGRLDENKNNKTLIKTISLIKDINVHLVICGDGEKKEELISYSNKLGVKNRIHFLGNCSNMNDMYSLADVFVMASYREGLSRSIMEAMSSGLPCVVSDIRGNRDLIVNKKNGFLVSPDDAEKFSEKIMYLKKNEYELRKIRENNIFDARKFDINKVKKEIYRIYEELLFNSICV